MVLLEKYGSFMVLLGLFFYSFNNTYILLSPLEKPFPVAGFFQPNI